jgi:oligogalacturonide transport system substrate-binding protein
MFGRPTLMFAVGRNAARGRDCGALMNFLLTDPEAARLLGRTRGLPSARGPLALLQAENRFPPLELAAAQQIQAARAAGRIDAAGAAVRTRAAAEVHARGLRDRGLRQGRRRGRRAPPGHEGNALLQRIT